MEGSYFQTGTHEGNGAAKNVSIGWKPKRVTVFNETDAITWRWTDTMAAGKGFKQAQNGDTTYEAANGISLFTGTAPTPVTAPTGATAGFTLGTGVNVNGKTLHWVAER